MRRDRRPRRHAGGLPVVTDSTRSTTTGGSPPSPRSAGRSIGSSASSWGRCSFRTAGSRRSTRTRAVLGIAVVHRRQALVAEPPARVGPPRASATCAARLPRLHRQRPGDRHGDVRLRLPARSVDVRSGRRSPSATGCGRPAIPRFHELNDLLQYLGAFTFRAPVPGLPPRRRDVVRAAWLGPSATAPRRRYRSGPKRIGRCWPTSSSGCEQWEAADVTVRCTQVKKLDTVEAFRDAL